MLGNRHIMYCTNFERGVTETIIISTHLLHSEYKCATVRNNPVSKHMPLWTVGILPCLSPLVETIPDDIYFLAG